jgi:LmbE family N-acetylglucosaminyl deacetylase
LKALVLAAHPDDVEICCAGTMALLARAGHEVVLAHMTYGDKGGRQDPDELARTRHAEAVEAAALIGAGVVGRICGDLELYDAEPHRAAVARLVEEIRPEVVVTHRPDDYHPDHRITGELALAAVRRTDPDVPVWFMDTVGSVEFHPSDYVDVGDTFDTKIDMIKCHRSQMSWMSTARHTDMPYMIEWAARWRGLQAGVEFAEGFLPAVEGAAWPFLGVSSRPVHIEEGE